MKTPEQIENEIELEDVVSDENIIEPLPYLKDTMVRRIVIKTLFVILGSAVLVLLGLFWQQRFDLLGWTNAFYFAGFIFFGFGFMVFAANNNIFSPLVYGTKSFFLMFAGKKPKLSYYDYVQDIKDHQLPKMLINLPYIACLPNIIIAIILHIIYNTQVYPYL